MGFSLNSLLSVSFTFFLVYLLIILKPYLALIINYIIKNKLKMMGGSDFIIGYLL